MCKMNKIIEHLCIIALFVFISLIFTYPIPLSIDVAYPTGVNLFLSTTVPLLSLISIPLQEFFGLNAAYNTMYLLSYILSAYFMYLLAFHITKDKKAAILAGLIFAFSPFHAGHAMRHLNLMSIQFVPLFVLSFLKLMESRNIQRILFFAISLALVFYSSFIYFVISSIFVLIYLLVKKFFLKKAIKNQIINLAPGIAIGLLLISPLLLNMINQILYTDYETSSNIALLIGYSADLVDFIRPMPSNPILGNVGIYLLDNVKNYIGAENLLAERSLYVGLTLLALISFGIWKIKNDEMKFWSYLLGIFFLLSLGPFLVIAGEIIPLFMPYTIFVPFLELMRVPARFGLLFFLCAAIIAAMTFKYLFENKSQNTKIAGFLIISFLILLEYFSPPSNFLDLTTSSFYEKIASDPSDYVILDVPFDTKFTSYTAYLVYLQTIHQKRTVSSALSRYPTYAVNYTKNDPCISKLVSLNITNLDCSKMDPKIKYVIFHKQDVLESIVSIEKNLTLEFDNPVFKDNEIVVYCAHKGEC
jgi:hypothetical protein